MSEEIETQDELPGMLPVGEKLRQARKAKGLEIEDIATKTRIPKRHLENLERAAWEKLPAPTYTMGFAKAYATEVGLDREEIAAELREQLADLPPVPTEDGYEVADPARSFPRWLIWLALIALVAAAGWFIYSNERALGDTDGEDQELLLDPEEERQAEAPSEGRVLLTANRPVDIRVTDGDMVLTEVSLATGQSFEVPAGATAPMLAVSDAGALRISVGTADAPSIGTDGQSVNGISLLAGDLMAAPQEVVATTPPPATAPAARSAPPPARSTPPPAQRRPSATPTDGGAAGTRPANSPTSGENDTPSVQFDTDAAPPPPLNPPPADNGDSTAD